MVIKKLIMKKISIILASVLMLSLTSCMQQYETIVTSGKVSTKEGVAKKLVILGIYLKADLSIATAAKNGGITKISTVVYGMRAPLGPLYQKYYTKVTGE